MRYERVEDILRLAMTMQSSYNGLSLNDIQDRFQVSRRTAERMRDTVVRLFPQIEEVDTGSKIKRWKLKTNSLIPFISFSSEELAEIKSAKNRYETEGLKIQASIIDQPK